MNNKAEPGLRLPASVSALGRTSHPAGRGPSLSSLFLPLAAVASAAKIEKDRHTNVKRQSPTVDIPEDWNPRAKQQPTGLIALLRRLRVALANFSAAPDRALKNWSAAPASPPCFRRWRRSALLLFKSRCGDRKRPAHECVPAHPAPESKRQSPTVDIPEDWDPRAKQQPTGLIACSAAQSRPVQIPRPTK